MYAKFMNVIKGYIANLPKGRTRSCGVELAVAIFVATAHPIIAPLNAGFHNLPFVPFASNLVIDATGDESHISETANPEAFLVIHSK